MDSPEITAVMLYYGRRNLGEEAVESFLRQTYPHKHLLIINTHPDPIRFEQEQADIEVQNIHPDPFKSLNEKYDFGFSQVRTQWWCPWDSDDIWLPWHFDNIVAGISEQRPPLPMKVGLPKCYFSDENIVNRVGWNMWANCIYETFDSSGERYPKCDYTKPDNCDGQILYTPWTRIWLRHSPKSYIFRWSQAPHGSAYRGEEGLAYHARCRAKMYARRNSEPFRPHWDRDYVKDVEEFETKLRQTQCA